MCQSYHANQLAPRSKAPDNWDTLTLVSELPVQTASCTANWANSYWLQRKQNQAFFFVLAC